MLGHYEIIQKNGFVQKKIANSEVGNHINKFTIIEEKYICFAISLLFFQYDDIMNVSLR